MKVKSVTVSMGVTVNLGNYESFRMDVSEEIEIYEGEDPEEAYASARDNLRKKIKDYTGK